MVSRFCTPPVDWPSQIKIAKTLISKFPDIEFWNNIEPIKLKNLAFFLTKKGEAFILLEQKKANLKPVEKESVSLEKEKLGEDFVSQPKKIPFITFKSYQ